MWKYTCVQLGTCYINKHLLLYFVHSVDLGSIRLYLIFRRQGHSHA